MAKSKLRKDVKYNLSIIIINYNTEKITRECIESIINNTSGITYEIIVVDNASSDGSVKMLTNLKSKISNLRLILNNKNLGFGEGNNQGFKIAKGEFFLLLNTDTKLLDNVLAQMVSWMKKHPDIGISSCALRFKDGSVQGTGGYFPHLSKIFAWMIIFGRINLIMIGYQ